MLIEQAIFTSAVTERAQGYQIVCRSPGLSEVDATELAVWGPRTRRRVTHSEGYAAPADAPVRRSTTEETY